MQERCYFCTRKHLGYAEAFMQEAINGYPLHKWLAVGQLCAAEGEIMCDHPEMAQMIREHRVKYIDDMHYEVPILDLIEKVTLLASQFEEHSDDVKYASEYGIDEEINEENE
ncbi:MAG: hypothetical protein ACOC56_04010 [Atribacterota bacterium]